MKLKYFSYLLPILFFTASANLYSQKVEKEYFDGEIYVKYNNDFAVDFSNEYVEPQSLVGLNKELVAEYGITQARFSFNKIPDVKLQRTVRIKFSTIDKAESLIKHFEQLPYIEYAEKIPIDRPTYTPNDFGQNNVGDIWHLYKIAAQKAWDFTKGDPNITVAVVDDEVDINHEDLKDNIWINPNEIPNNGIDDDGNGYIDDIHGWDVSDNDNVPSFYNNIYLDHGTSTAGLVSATTNNNIGVSSIGFNLKIIAIKGAPDNHTQNSIPQAYDGILYAASVNADIISCSWGGHFFSNTNDNIVKYAESKGCLVVASAGNHNRTDPHYPSDYSKVISVAASDINDKKASFSNYGHGIDVISPGVSTKTLFNGNAYKSFSGTSASCPITAGLLGLMKSYMPTISNSDLKQCLVNSTDNIYNLNPNYIGQLGSGRINAEKALLCVDSVKKSPPTIEVSINKNYICPLEKITLTASSYKRPLDSVYWYIHKENKIELLKGLQVETSFEKDSIYSITVIGFDEYGKDFLPLQKFIHVNSLYKNIIYFEDFENTNENYSVINPDNGITWEKTRADKTNNINNTALKLNFYESDNLGQRDAFILPPLNLLVATIPKLTFQYAYPVETFNSDSLIIYVSTDSGKTFKNRVFEVNLPDIYTAPNHYWSFKPDDNTEWCINHWYNRCKTIDLTPYGGLKNVVLKFEAVYGGGNNLYLDDIKVFTDCGDFITSKPISSFTSIDTTVCLNDSIQFAATSTSFPETYQWIFEGGIADSVTIENPKVYYSDTGTFDVTLITSNVLGADTLTLKDYITVASLPKVTVSDTQQYVCPNDSVFFTAWGTDSIVWKNINTGKIIIDSILGDRPIQNTSYMAKAISKFGCEDSTTVKAIRVPLPPNVSLSQVIDSLRAIHNSGSFTYKWYINDTFTNLYATKKIKPYKTANYKVEIIDSAGCSRISQNFFVSTVGIKKVLGESITIFPNPVDKALTISGLNDSPSSITITDVLGREVIRLNTANDVQTVDVSTFDRGVYLVKISQNGQSVIRKIIVE